MHREYSDSGLNLVAVYGVVNDEIDTEEGTRKLTEEQEYTFPVLYDSENRSVKAFGVRSFPRAFLVDPQGDLLWIGDPRRSEFETAVKNALNLPLIAEQPDSVSAIFAGRGEFQLTDREAPAVRAKQGGALREIRRYDLPPLIVDAQPGQVVADVGSGSGRFSFPIADDVGEKGMVYCRDINPGAINAITRKADDRSVTHIDAQVSRKDDVQLPEDTVDIALLSDVYHFVVRQEATDGFLDSLYQSMKPGGVVVVTHVTTRLLFKEEDWKPYFDRTINDFASHGFETGRRWIIDDEDDNRPILVLEFRRPSNDSENK